MIRMWRWASAPLEILIIILGPIAAIVVAVRVAAAPIITHMSYCLRMLGGLPKTLVWDREGALHAGQGRATDELAAFCGQLPVGWLILEARDPESKGALERSHRFLRSSFEPARAIAGPEHFQAELDTWSRAARSTARTSSRS